MALILSTSIEGFCSTTEINVYDQSHNMISISVIIAENGHYRYWYKWEDLPDYRLYYGILKVAQGAELYDLIRYLDDLRYGLDR